MDYSIIAEQINNIQKETCFKLGDRIELNYLASLDLPKEVLEFYSKYSPIDTVEINGIRLLPITEIIEENTNYTPGYLLTPLGFCVIATTIQGDLYCISKKRDNYTITIASHDEIYEGQSDDEIVGGTKEVFRTFIDFLIAFTRKELKPSFYDLDD